MGGGGGKELFRFRISRMCQALPTHIRGGGAQVSMQPRARLQLPNALGMVERREVLSLIHGTRREALPGSSRRLFPQRN